jgi:TPR repeat protein
MTLPEARRVEEALKNGDPGSYGFHALGDIYDQGGEKAMDREEATRCYLHAAESGAMVSDYAVVARRIFAGIGSHGTDAEAVAVLKSGVEAGDASSAFLLGGLHERGEHGLARDLAEARRLYGIAIERGSDPAYAAALEALPKD